MTILTAGTCTITTQINRATLQSRLRRQHRAFRLSAGRDDHVRRGKRNGGLFRRRQSSEMAELSAHRELHWMLWGIFIEDIGNNRIRKVSAAGVITTVAGNGVYSYFGDNGLATSAELSEPGIAVDASGNLFIADATDLSNRIRKVSAATGIVTTVAGNGTPNAELGFSGDNGASHVGGTGEPPRDRGGCFKESLHRGHRQRSDSEGVDRNRHHHDHRWWRNGNLRICATMDQPRHRQCAAKPGAGGGGCFRKPLPQSGRAIEFGKFRRLPVLSLRLRATGSWGVTLLRRRWASHVRRG